MGSQAMSIAETVYRNYSPAGQGVGVFPLVKKSRVLEVGFGSGALLQALINNDNEVHGTDVSEKIITDAKASGIDNVHLVDVSETPLPFADDFFDAVYCYEVFEHLTNPHRLFFEIRRVLKSNHLLYFSVPSQEMSMGYGPSRHTFVYPGLLERHNLERFFMQMYFKIDAYLENTEGIIHHRNYALNNMKHLGLPDVMEVIIGDYAVTALYDQLLDEQALETEIRRETQPYFTVLHQAAAAGAWEVVDSIVAIFTVYYPQNYALLIKSAEILLSFKNKEKSKEYLKKALTIKPIPNDIYSEISLTIEQL
jgi:ubiquinone/menaquinone biosynthesis C-methylase UbiE